MIDLEKERMQFQEKMDEHFRNGMKVVEFRLKAQLGKTLLGSKELRTELSYIKAVRKILQAKPDQKVTDTVINYLFRNYPLTQQEWLRWQEEMERDERVQKLDFISNLSHIVHHQRALASVKGTRLILAVDEVMAFQTPYGYLPVINFDEILSETEKEKIEEEVKALELIDSHTLAPIYVKYIKGDLVTGYVNSSIPKVRALHTWILKNGWYYDVMTGMALSEANYCDFYEPEIVQSIPYHEVVGCRKLQKKI